MVRTKKSGAIRPPLPNLTKAKSVSVAGLSEVGQEAQCADGFNAVHGPNLRRLMGTVAHARTIDVASNAY